MKFPSILGAWVNETPMPEDEKTDLRRHTREWWDNIPFSDESFEALKKEGKQPTLKMQFRKWGENPMVRYAGIIIWLMGLRFIREMKNPQPDEQEEEF